MERADEIAEEMIYLIVPCHLARIQKFVDCLNRQTLKPVILWVDCGINCKERLCETYHGDYEKRHVSPRNYWCGCLEYGQGWIEKTARPDDIVGIMNNDLMIETDYFEKVSKYVDEGFLVSSVVFDQATGKMIQSGVLIRWDLWNEKSRGILPSENSYFSESTCFANYGIFLKVKDFLGVKFHPHFLPHYYSDYAWTIDALKRLTPFVPSDLKVYVDFSTSSIKPKRLRDFFSKRYSENPICLINFILLYCPWKYKVQNVLRVLLFTAIRMCR